MSVARFETESGQSFLVEVDEDDWGVDRVGRGAQDVILAGGQVEAAVENVGTAAEVILKTLTTLAPQKVSIEFGIKLNAAAGVIIAKTEAEGHFTVRLEWASGSRNTPAPSDGNAND